MTRTRRSRRPLVGLLTADGVSVLGTRMSALAVPWFVLATNGSPTAAGVAAFAELAPYVVVQALGGPALDRLGAWRTRIGADLGAGVLVAVVPLLWGLGALPFGALCAVLAVVGIARGLGDTAGYVLLPGVVEPAGTPMARVTGLHDGVRRVAGLVGAPLAGALVAVWSAPAVLVVDAASFALAALLVLATVPRSAQPARAVAGDAGGPAPATSGRGRSVLRTYAAELAEGFRFLRGDRLLLGIATMVTVTNLLDQAGSAVLTPVWATDVAHSPLALGLVSGAVGLGAVVGNAAVTWLGPRLPRRTTFGVGFLVAGAPRYVALALASTLGPVLPVVLASGVGAGVLNPVIGAVEFERVPRALQARVLGTTNAVAWLGMPVGGLLAGLAVDRMGLRTALLGVATVYLLTTLAPFVFPAWRAMADPPVEAGTGAEAPASSNSAGVGATPAG